MSEQHGGPWEPGAGAGEPPAPTPSDAEAPPSRPTGGVPPWAVGRTPDRPTTPQADPPFGSGVPGAAGPADPAGAATPPTWTPPPTTPAPAFGGPAPFPGPAAPVPGFTGAPSPYGATPTVALPGAAPVPYDRPTRKVSSGIPPTLGLAVVFLSLPAVATLLYGLAALFAGVLFASLESSSEVDFQEGAASLGGIGVVLVVLGLIGVASVVGLAAGSATGRLICTLFVSLSIFIQIVGFALNASAGGLIGLAVLLSVPLYCLWAMWGGRSHEVF